MNGENVLYTDFYEIKAGEVSGINFAPLSIALNDAKAKVAADYTAASFARLTAAITEGEAALVALQADPETTQSRIDVEAAKMNAAISALISVVALNEKIAEAKAYDAMAYSPTSFSRLLAKIAGAEAILNAEDPTAIEIRVQIDAIDAAIKALVEAAVPHNPDRINIALDQNGGVATAEYTNGWCTSNNGGALRINDGVLNSASPNTSATSWNSYGYNPTGGANYPAGDVKVWVEWDAPVVVDGTRVMWLYEGTAATNNISSPENCTVQYLDADGNYVTVSNMKDTSGADVSSVGILGNGNNADNTLWNEVSFDAVTTTKLQLTIRQKRTSTTNAAGGVGIFEWEVFGNKAGLVGNNISISEDIVIEASNTSSEDAYSPVFAMTSAEDKNIKVIVAEYDASGRLANSAILPVALEANVPATDIRIAIPKTEGNTYRFFIWDANFVPLTSKTSFEEAPNVAL
jgi:hypothetical protein